MPYPYRRFDPNERVNYRTVYKYEYANTNMTNKYYRVEPNVLSKKRYNNKNLPYPNCEVSKGKSNLIHRISRQVDTRFRIRIRIRIVISRQTLPCIFFVDKPNMPQYHDRSDFIRRNTWRIYILITEEFVSSLSFASASFNYNIGNKRSCTTTTIRFEIVCTSLLLLVLRLPLFLIRFTNPSVSVVALIDQQREQCERRQQQRKRRRRRKKTRYYHVCVCVCVCMYVSALSEHIN